MALVRVVLLYQWRYVESASMRSAPSDQQIQRDWGSRCLCPRSGLSETDPGCFSFRIRTGPLGTDEEAAEAGKSGPLVVPALLALARPIHKRRTCVRKCIRPSHYIIASRPKTCASPPSVLDHRPPTPLLLSRFHTIQSISCETRRVGGRGISAARRPPQTVPPPPPMI